MLIIKLREAFFAGDFVLFFDLPISTLMVMLKYIFFIIKTKDTMEKLNFKPIEHAKIKYAIILFAELSMEKVVYNDVNRYQSMLYNMEIFQIPKIYMNELNGVIICFMIVHIFWKN